MALYEESGVDQNYGRLMNHNLAEYGVQVSQDQTFNFGPGIRNGNSASAILQREGLAQNQKIRLFGGQHEAKCVEIESSTNTMTTCLQSDSAPRSC
ncbi:hypothetical protein [Edaphobacter paludis]|uniref:hypothetical protein n=1 Tax=Edaphobacter paludis TaxID=3035702 RepID=UPI00359FA7E9